MTGERTAVRPCDEHREDLHAYLDGELQLAEAAALEDHLRGCGGCRDEVATLGSLRRALRVALPSVRAPAELRARVRALVDGRTALPDEPRALPPAATRAGRVLLAAAAVVLAAAGGLALASRVLPHHDGDEALHPTPLALAVADLHDDADEAALEVVGPGSEQVADLLESGAGLPGHPVVPEEADLLGARLVSFSPDGAGTGPGAGHGASPGLSALRSVSRRGAVKGGTARNVAIPARRGELAGEMRLHLGSHLVTVIVFDVLATPVHFSGKAVRVGGRDGFVDRVGATNEIFFVDGFLGYAVVSDAPLEMLLHFAGGLVSVH
ncbi:MAG TPA: zf-HC2 domain-containing protein [Myxococcota bacterium]|jgi:hypothetical protein|nr:zf-HC2 domain-containing protein [Myxococcota bacterium]